MALAVVLDETAAAQAALSWFDPMALLMVVSRFYFKSFFSRKLEAVKPGCSTNPWERAPAHF